MWKKIFGKKKSPNIDLDQDLLATIDKETLPRHVAIIMDGNGRWANKKGMLRSAGHVAGVKALKRTLKAAIYLNLEALTVYAFSTENWKRPTEEVDFLMKLFSDYLEKELDEMDRDNVHIDFIGRVDGFSAHLQKMMEDAKQRTADNTGVRFTVAVNYGGQDEMVRTVQSLARDVAAGKLAPEDIDAGLIDSSLDTGDLPPVDLVIRTSGDMRLSNFLIWQTAYAEFWFTDTNWPDFSKDDFAEALIDFSKRDRRFGGLSKRNGDK
ncbi:MAG: isoprenyl transferase [Anaerovibrio sp.]|uniref:isoprenyl transferase n=1 Tax=Anaerovibrio sp. TaxID=1872532 RepID=UPI0025DEC651|nr:isoprenyl transferase [Anaerovibrio sp.]MCR5175282.1 isoprenyl transferase [Anaerovibrio sp.]